MFRLHGFFILSFACLVSCSVDDVDKNGSSVNMGNTTSTISTATAGTQTAATTPPSGTSTSVSSGTSTGTMTAPGQPNLVVVDQVQFSFFGVPGVIYPQTLTLQNTGDAPLKLQEIAVLATGSASFMVMSPTDPDDLLNPAKQSQTLPREIPAAVNEAVPGAVFLTIMFAPKTLDYIEEELLIRSDDPNRPTVTVSLAGNVGARCVRMEGDVQEVSQGEMQTDEMYLLDFGQVLVGQEQERLLTVSNCSLTQPLYVSPKRGGQPQGSAFTIKMGGGRMLQDFNLPPGAKEELSVTLDPKDTTPALERLTFKTDDPMSPEVRVDLRAQGTEQPCPTARAVGVLLGSPGMPPGMPSQSVQAAPLQTIKLLSAGSVNVDGSTTGLGYQWSIVSRPARSLARVLPGDAREPLLFLDLVGRYVVELTVVDAMGVKGCSPARVQIDATPITDIYLELSWETPLDLDPTDSIGADIDLHFLHPNSGGIWNAQRWDVYWRQSVADWGVTGDPRDDPSLELEDTDGFGPEVIVLDNPESGKTYAIGAYYYDDNGFGPSTANLKIFIEGILKLDLSSGPMAMEDTFWSVGTVSWPSRQIILQNRISPGASVPGIGF